MNFIRGPLTWAFVIIIGGLMITPEGIVPIVTNSAIQLLTGVILIAPGVTGFASRRRS
ncbi:MAG: hypothetical protein OEV42_10030 [Deltaproteobacteria bacterium]|nr:hypothetical protein [Deltaproteobacteria bacterium]